MAGFDESLEVPAAKTPVSMSQALTLLRANAPDWSEREIEYALALFAVENARGSAIIANNWGNLSAGGFVNGVESAAWNGTYWRPPWFRQSGSLHDEMLAGRAPSAFRAYSSQEEGITRYVGFLEGDQWAPLRSAAKADNAAAYVAALHDTGYSRNYNAKHVPTFTSLISEIRRTLGTKGAGSAVVTDDKRVTTDNTAAIVLGVVAVVAVVGGGAMIYVNRKR